MPFRRKLRRFVGEGKKLLHLTSEDARPLIGQDASPPSRPATEPGIGRSAVPTGTPMRERAMSLSLLTSTSPRGEIPGWIALKSFIRTLNALGDFDRLKVVTDRLATLLEMHEATLSERKESKSLRRDLEDLFEDLERAITQGVSVKITGSIGSLCWGIQRQLDAIQENTKDGPQKGSIEDGENLIRALRQIEAQFQRILLNVQIETWGIADELITELRLENFCPSASAHYNSTQADALRRGACSPGTRLQVLASIHVWATNEGTNTVFWLNGMAGTGKTAISYSFCQELDSHSALAASFFCSRAIPECRDARLIIPSIAYQLGCFSRPFRAELARILEEDPDVHARSPAIQFNALISKPLYRVQDTLAPNLIVVVDGLDECEDKRAVHKLVDLLFARAHEQAVKFFITSRPDAVIHNQMTKYSPHCSQIALHELDSGVVRGDIESYLRDALAPIQPSQEDIRTLAEYSGGLYIYAATVVRYVAYDNFRRNPHARIKQILNRSSEVDSGASEYREIDELYLTVLRAVFEDKRLKAKDKEAMRYVLHTVICAQEPLASTTLSRLLRLDSTRVDTIVQKLGSVLHVGTSGIITTLHASFPDFLFSQSRSQDYYCNSQEHNRVMAERCFRCMKDQVKFNICALDSSFLLDSDVEGLEERVRLSIPVELAYASRHWATHLSLGDSPREMAPLVKEFLSSHFLLWTEIMNLKGYIRAAVDEMRLAEDWIMQHLEELTELAHDAWRFVTMLASAPVSLSTPHIYTSMLSFWPEGSPIATLNTKRGQGLIQLEGTAMSQQPLELLATWSMGGMTAAIMSPDGSFIAVGIGNEILVLDAYTGRIRGTIEGHVGRISALGFSPDCRQLASGAHDDTVRVWEVSTGRLILGPLRGHTYVVTSVMFSPDGALIASGSRDATVRIWSAFSGDMAGKPLLGHTGSITAVRFYPDGTRVVSGSRDSIRVWDAVSGRQLFQVLTTSSSLAPVALSPDGRLIISAPGERGISTWDSQGGDIVLSPLEGHGKFITTVAVSPDGTTVASGSDDGTIHLWDLVNGELLSGPLLGHTGPVNFVAFFPDGRLLMSSSSDDTIRVWDPKSGKASPGSLEVRTEPISCVAMSADGRLIASGSSSNTVSLRNTREPENPLPLKLHTAPVLSVTFSPDGVHVVSGSADATLCIWNAQSGELVVGPLEGHVGSVTSVAFSPDGRNIISGSNDNTLRLWDPKTGSPILVPFQGHTGPVTAVSFSPDGTFISSASQDKTIRIWKIGTGGLITVIGGHSGAITSVHFSPDAQRIVSGSEDKTIYIWSLEGKALLGPIEGHTGAVLSVCFSPDGTRIVSGSADCSLRMWDSKSGELLLGPLKEHIRAVRSVGFSPDGSVFSGSDDGTIKVIGVQEQKSALSNSGSDGKVINWTANKDGWVVDDQSQLLVWIPPALIASLMSPRTTLLISPRGYLRLNFENALIGKAWTECFAP